VSSLFYCVPPPCPLIPSFFLPPSPPPLDPSPFPTRRSSDPRSVLGQADPDTRDRRHRRMSVRRVREFTRRARTVHRHVAALALPELGSRLGLRAAGAPARGSSLPSGPVQPQHHHSPRLVAHRGLAGLHCEVAWSLRHRRGGVCEQPAHPEAHRSEEHTSEL